MKITTVLFDLDGTLLPMDNEEFTKAYFKLLAKNLLLTGMKPGSWWMRFGQELPLW